MNKSELACQSFKLEPEKQKQENTSSSEREAETEQQDSQSNQPEEIGKEDRGNS